MLALSWPCWCRPPSHRRDSARPRLIQHRSWDPKVKTYASGFQEVRSGESRGHASTPAVELCDLHDQVIPYDKAWEVQRYLVEEVGAGRRGAGVVMILQHEPVYTLGAGSTKANLKFDVNQPPYPLHRTERGGEVTYHGPGQLVVYPILDLRRFRQDLHWFMRSLEEAVIRSLWEVSSLKAHRISGRTGVWIKGKKLAAFGIRARSWVTYHGLALNICPDLRPFEKIVPCGISDAGVGSIWEMVAVQDDEHQDNTAYSAKNQKQELLKEYAVAIQCALADVLGLQFADLAQGIPSHHSRW